jgi:hypothetical protein
VEQGQLILQEGVYRYRHLSRSNTTAIEILVNQSIQIIRVGDTSVYPLFHTDRLIFGNRLAIYIISYNLADDDEVYVSTEQASE